MAIYFVVASFRAAFPAFSDVTAYPDATLQANWTAATFYIGDSDYGYLSGAARTRALSLMTAHITKLSAMLAIGLDQELVARHKIGGGVDVTVIPPPAKNQFQWWSNLTEYGTQMLALLTVKSAGGMYFSGVRALR